jgi:hypothetical protein
MEPLPQLHAVNPAYRCRHPQAARCKQQMREDYRTSPIGAQRELLQPNPSGLGRQEEAIGRGSTATRDRANRVGGYSSAHWRLHLCPPLRQIGDGEHRCVGQGRIEERSHVPPYPRTSCGALPVDR